MTFVIKKQTPMMLFPDIRVATAQEKQGIWLSIFPDRENTRNLRNLIKTGNFDKVEKMNNLV